MPLTPGLLCTSEESCSPPNFMSLERILVWLETSEICHKVGPFPYKHLHVNKRRAVKSICVSTGNFCFMLCLRSSFVSPLRAKTKKQTKLLPEKLCDHSRVLGLEGNSESAEEPYVYQRLAETFAFCLSPPRGLFTAPKLIPFPGYMW